MKSHYKVLGVKSSADNEEIKKAYKATAKRLHPDKNPRRSEKATKLFQELQHSVEVLLDPKSRSEHDKELEAYKKASREKEASPKENPEDSGPRYSGNESLNKLQRDLEEIEEFFQFIEVLDRECVII
uniref:DnaJ homolog subfamily B member 8 n=1 Tax=Caligus clemensi TaxID=344056 RepID=C1C146_CALCM|nr:DnaJ homolog subfamily B member 8 [Caligus clemensi]